MVPERFGTSSDGMRRIISGNSRHLGMAQEDRDRLLGSFEAPGGIRHERQIREALDSASGAAASKPSNNMPSA